MPDDERASAPGLDDWPKHFDHATREPTIYEAWRDSGAFHADGNSVKKVFAMVMPPPNATGPLHIGHALTLTIEDLMVRRRRMAGDEVLWLPGMDHASIATEMAVIRRLEEAGKPDPRRTMSRAELRQAIEQHVKESRQTIRAQIEALGSSCDWSRERYTLEPELNRIVNETFGRMFRDGLIYRGNRIVNWDVSLGTTLSDDEIYLKEEDKGSLYFIQYGPLQVATDRPEMRLGDTALAVHPEDPRYRKHIGRDVTLSLPNKNLTIRVKVIADSNVDRDFGTGVAGVTPAHDAADFEIAKRHRLPLVTIIGEDGRMTDAAHPYTDMTPMQCRAAFVQDLRDAHLLIRTQPHAEKVHYSYRGEARVIFLPKEQWFIDVNRPKVEWSGRTMSLRQVMADVVRTEAIRFIPEYQEDIYFHWIDNLRDWCISRQIVWGHRVPVWYRSDSETYVGGRPPEGDGWRQDPDTLDTWFSSALWTWSTLTDRAATADQALSLGEIFERSPDYQRFHPTTVLETGYDILFFWVARMILMTTYMTGRIPFEKVYLHGLVRDREPRRLPAARMQLRTDLQSIIKESGADALRLALITRTSTGIDTHFSDQKIRAARGFVNKLFHAARYVVAHGRFDSPRPVQADHPVNRWICRKTHATAERVTSAIDKFSFGAAAALLEESCRMEFCDLYIEATKATEFQTLAETGMVLGYVLEIYLKLAHPFIPFVTEDLWKRTGHEGFLMQQTWPECDAAADDAESDSVDALFEIVKAVRNRRQTSALPPKTELDLQVATKRHREVLERCVPLLRHLAKANSVEFVTAELEGALTIGEDLSVTIAVPRKES